MSFSGRDQFPTACNTCGGPILMRRGEDGRWKPWDKVPGTDVASKAHVCPNWTKPVLVTPIISPVLKERNHEHRLFEKRTERRTEKQGADNKLDPFFFSQQNP